MARWAQHQDTEPDSEEVTDRILALLSAPEPAEDHKAGKRLDGFAALYALVYPIVVEVGRGHGYVMGLHGSLARDLDVIAAPWVGQPSEPADVVEEICHRLGAIAGEDLCTVPPERGPAKPHREVWNVVLRGGAFLDISFALRSSAPAPADPRPMECSVCGAGYIGSRAGEVCGVEGCDGRLYFVVAETGERAYGAPWSWATVNSWLAQRGYEKRRLVMPNDDDVTPGSPAPTAAEPAECRAPMGHMYCMNRVPCRIPGHEEAGAVERVRRALRTASELVRPIVERELLGESWPGDIPFRSTAAEPEREAPTPETERLFEAVLYGVRCGRGAVNDAACESIAREVIAALATPEAEGGST
jgi:hypothetical protein